MGYHSWPKSEDSASPILPREYDCLVLGVGTLHSEIHNLQAEPIMERLLVVA
jgi:hypothetical protein